MYLIIGRLPNAIRQYIGYKHPFLRQNIGYEFCSVRQNIGIKMPVPRRGKLG